MTSALGLKRPVKLVSACDIRAWVGKIGSANLPAIICCHNSFYVRINTIILLP